MADNPITPEPQKPRRWFQFRLRTLLIVVVLFSIPCAYVGWQLKIVRHRIAERELLEQRGAKFLLMDRDVFISSRHESPSRLRMYLGDCDVSKVRLPFLGPPDQLVKDRREVKESAERAFPEAEVVDSLGFLEFDEYR